MMTKNLHERAASQATRTLSQKIGAPGQCATVGFDYSNKRVPGGVSNNDPKEPASRFDCYKFLFHRACLATFATWGNSGIEPDEGERISSPGRYEAILMRPRSDGEQQWNATWDWTCR